MEVLAPEKRRAIRMIRDELCCMICSRVFDDPHCLDCKHNFCRDCIFTYMRRADSSCPKCKLPMRPSEVTRNQFLQSILSAWIAAEDALAPLEDPNSADILNQQEKEDMEAEALARQQQAALPATGSRGPVASNKWDINTTELRQEAEAAQRRANTAAFGASLAERAALKNAALANENHLNGGLDSQRSVDMSQTQMNSGLSQLQSPPPSLPPARRQSSAVSPQTLASSSLSSPFSVMSTQDVEGYMKKIQSQNHFLDEWAKKSATVTQYTRDSPATRTVPTISAVQRVKELMATTSINANTVNKSAGKRKRRIFAAARSDDEDEESADDSGDEDYVEDGDGRSETQMPATAADSPDLLGFAAAIPRRVVQQRLSPQAGEVTSVKAKRPRAVSSPIRPSARLQATTPPVVSQRQVVVPASQPQDVVDMTGADDDDDEVEVVEESQVPLVQQHTKKPASKRASADFQVAIQAFQDRQPGAAKHRLSGGGESFFAQQRPASSTQSAAVRQATVPPLGAAFVFVGTDLTKDESKRVLIACQRLGGRFGRDFDLKKDEHGGLTTSVTHLITKAVTGLRCKRTAKFMRALAEGTCVVDYAWVEDSLKAGQWLSEDKYEMVGDIYSDAVGKPRESRLLRLRSGRRNDIFRKFQFVLLSPADEFDFHIDSVRAIVVHFGATVELADPNNSDDLPEQQGKTNIGIVSKVAEPADAKHLWSLYHIPIVRVTWIFDSISYLQVKPFDDYYPY